MIGRRRAARPIDDAERERLMDLALLGTPSGESSPCVCDLCIASHWREIAAAIPRSLDWPRQPARDRSGLGEIRP